MLERDDVPRPVTHDPDLLAELGLLPGLLMPSAFARRWDKRDDYSPSMFDDEGWIGEDAGGVWLRAHPDTAVAQDAQLWDVESEWRYRTEREIGADDFAGRSHWWLAAWLTKLGAMRREEVRRIRERD